MEMDGKGKLGCSRAEVLGMISLSAVGGAGGIGIGQENRSPEKEEKVRPRSERRRESGRASERARE